MVITFTNIQTTSSGGGESGGTMTYYAGDYIDITDSIISVTGVSSTEEVKEMISDAQAETEAKIPSLEGLATEQYVDDKVKDLQVYQNGDYIDITDNIISVTGLTTPEYVQEEIKASGNEMKGYVDNTLSGYSTTEQVQGMITSAQTETQEWVEDKGYLTEQSLTGYSTTEQVQEMITSAQTETEAKIPSLTGYATEDYVDNAVSGKVDTTVLEGYYTSGQTDEAINDAVSGIPRTFKTVNDESVVGEGNIDTNQIVELTQEEYDALEEKDENILYIITDADYLNFKTINGQSIIGTGNIVIEGGEGGGATYTAGDNIDITDNVISVTGIPTTFKTVNGQDITGEGNIVIEGGSGTGGETVIELTQEEYDALTEYAENTTYIITDAEAIDMGDYYTKTDVDGIVGDINNILETI